MCIRDSRISSDLVLGHEPPLVVGIVLDAVEARLVLPVIVSARERGSSFHPYNLRPDGEPALLQALRDHRSMQPAMPNVGDRPGKQGPGFAPVGPVIIG